jgi:hypothetical protein
LASDKNLAKVLTKTQEIQQQLKNLVTQDIIGGGNQSTQRKPLTNFINVVSHKIVFNCSTQIN